MSVILVLLLAAVCACVSAQVCQPLTSDQLEIRCWSSSKSIPCNKPLPHGTRAYFRCLAQYVLKNNRPLYEVITCRNGQWSEQLPTDICRPVCGQPNPRAGDKALKVSRFPWHVAIYKRDSPEEEWNYICGGSIVSQKVIVTAAHCIATFDDDYHLEQENTNLYRIGVGKYFSDMNSTEDAGGQLYEVSKFCTPPLYVGDLRSQADDIGFIILKESLAFNALVAPVCLDADVKSMSKFQLTPGTVGQMPGWYNKYSPLKGTELKVLDLPYVPPKICDTIDDLTFRTRLTHDKMCVGDLNSTTAVCSGHAGGGLVFYSRKDRSYYLHGVASSGPRECRGRSYYLFTKISTYVCDGAWNSFCSV